MNQITYQPTLRPALLEVTGCKDYREERDLFIRIDGILNHSGIDYEFIELSIQQKQVDLKSMSAAQTDFFYRRCLMALRGNIARLIKNLPHREFCKLLPDSNILRWFLGIEMKDSTELKHTPKAAATASPTGSVRSHSNPSTSASSQCLPTQTTPHHPISTFRKS